MKWPSRTRKIILWSAASVSVLLAAAWIGSMWWQFVCFTPHDDLLLIRSGYVRCLWASDYQAQVSALGIDFRRNRLRVQWWFDGNWTATVKFVYIPLWAPLTLSTAITAFAWRKEVIARRRANQHRCPACGYDMAGLAAAVSCPECGKKDTKA